MHCTYLRLTHRQPLRSLHLRDVVVRADDAQIIIILGVVNKMRGRGYNSATVPLREFHLPMDFVSEKAY